MSTRKSDMAGSLVWAFIRPFGVITGGLLMLVMLLLLCMEADMLKEYWKSERVYAAGVEQIAPEHEGCLVRVIGPLCTDDVVSVGNLGTYSGVIEVQNLPTIAHADGLRLGAWQVQGLYDRGDSPFCYFAVNTPGVNWVEVGQARLAMLLAGAEVTLVGRQRGNVLDMADPAAKASLGKPAAGFLSRVNDSPNADISLRNFQGVAFFALLAYFGIWLFLGLAVRGSLRWGAAAGAALLSVVVIAELISALWL